jgi:hypothetical protein
MGARVAIQETPRRAPAPEMEISGEGDILKSIIAGT